jgi:hypothetical protein
VCRCARCRHRTRPHTLGGQPGVSDLIEYESRLNDTLAHFPDVVICAYDLTKFAGHVIVDVLRCHRVVIVARRLREENPFYSPPVISGEQSAKV